MEQHSDIDSTRRVRRPTDALWRRVGSALVVLPAASDDPLVVNGAACALWRILERPASIASIAAELARDLGADEATVVEDLTVAIDELVGLGVLATSS